MGKKDSHRRKCMFFLLSSDCLTDKDAQSLNWWVSLAVIIPQQHFIKWCGGFPRYFRPGLLPDPTDADLSNDSLFFPSQTSKNLKIPFRKINFLFIVTQTYPVQSSLCKHSCSFKLAFVNRLGFFGCLLRLGSSVPWGKKKERFTSIYGLIFRHAEYLPWTLRAVPLKIRSPMWCWKERAQGKRRALIFKHTQVFIWFGEENKMNKETSF